MVHATLSIGRAELRHVLTAISWISGTLPDSLLVDYLKLLRVLAVWTGRPTDQLAAFANTQCLLLYKFAVVIAVDAIEEYELQSHTPITAVGAESAIVQIPDVARTSLHPGDKQFGSAIDVFAPLGSTHLTA